ncbi:hypothetical protein CL659_01240 [bacterium]|nr:hypothetical protein [bacterium]|tara:strand:- start:32233 stop:32727 length:495 start_codon:yes stop_codon:yes gene_type:complete
MRFLIDKGPLVATFIRCPETDECRELLSSLKGERCQYGDVQGIISGYHIGELFTKLSNPSIIYPPFKHNLMNSIVKELESFGNMRIFHMSAYELDKGLEKMEEERFYTSDVEEANLYWTIKNNDIKRIVTFNNHKFRGFPDIKKQTPKEFLKDLKNFTFRSAAF